jgi:hypothetical protein
MACRGIVTLKPVLDVTEKRRQYFAHVTAIRTRGTIINTRHPSPPGRLTHHRKFFRWMQRAMLRAGEDNLKLIDQSRKAPARLAKLPTDVEGDRDWVHVRIRQRVTRTVYRRPIRPAFAPPARPPPGKEGVLEGEGLPEQEVQEK